MTIKKQPQTLLQGIISLLFSHVFFIVAPQQPLPIYQDLSIRLLPTRKFQNNHYCVTKINNLQKEMVIYENCCHRSIH